MWLSPDSDNFRWISIKAKQMKICGAKLQGLRPGADVPGAMPASYRKNREICCGASLTHSPPFGTERQGYFSFSEVKPNMELRDRDTGLRIAGRVKEASTFFARFRGLMFTASLKADHALHLAPCRSVHTFFMKYPIDVLYLDASGTVVGFDERLQPNRLGSSVRGARSVVELPEGRIREARIAIGARLEFQPSAL